MLFIVQKSSSPHGTAELLVVHGLVVFPSAPHLGYSGALDKPEDAHFSVLPFDEGRVVARVFEQVTHKLPQVVTARCYGNRQRNDVILI